MRNFAGILLGSAALTLAVAPSISDAQTGATALPRAHPAITHTPPADSVCWSCGKPDGVPAPNPPAHFNPLTASDEQLDHYGFPPRPDVQKSPADYAFWKKLVTLPVKRIQPTQQATTIKNGPNQVRSTASRRAVNGPTGSASGNWSGYAVVSSKNPFKAKGAYVYGTFVVPVVYNATCDGGTDYSSDWVGIDGYGSDDVFQAGIEADASCSGSTTSSFFSAWYEWYPNYETRVSSPGVQPGDVIYVVIWTSSDTKGSYYIVNETQGTASSLTFKAPSGTTLKGNSVEWIVERPGVNGGLATLAYYTNVPWYYAFGDTASSVEYSPSNAPTGTLYSITMQNDGTNLSCSFATPDSQLTYTDPSGDGYYWPGSALWFYSNAGTDCP